MRKSYGEFGAYYNTFITAQQQIVEKATEFVAKVLGNSDTERCGELIEERLRIKSENSFSCNIEVVTIDKVVYNKDRGIEVIDEDGGVIKWEYLYPDDIALIADTIYTRFKEDFVDGKFDVCVDGKSVLNEYVDYLSAYEIQNDYKAKNMGYVGIDEI